MAARGSGNNGNGIGVLVLEISASGALLGLSGFMLKAGLLNVSGILGFLLNINVWLAGILGLGGFLFMQKALHHGHVSVVTPVIGGISIALPVVMAFLFLGETVSAMKWLGIALIVGGVIGLGKQE